MLEPKLFHRRMEAALDQIPGGGSLRVFAKRLVPRLYESLGESMGLDSIELYERAAKGASRVASAGDSVQDLGLALDREDGGQADEWADSTWLGRLGADEVGLLRLDDEQNLLLALRFRESRTSPSESAALSAAVSSLQYAIGQHRRRRELEDLIDQARAIQVSLLPGEPPVFGDFDLAGVSVPARIVGGDFYDFMPLDPETLALTVADASGHGLPAALQARDVATGLRMGVERDLKITRTVEKLNRVIHKSGLVSRFASMVFGELELNGNLSYINAGHPPPLLLDDGGIHELTVGGMVLGPTPDASYKLGFAHVDRGAALVLYTDGVVECAAEGGEFFGTDRLAAWLADWRGGPSGEAVADLFSRLRAFRGTPTFEDDVTVVFVRRPAGIA